MRQSANMRKISNLEKEIIAANRENAKKVSDAIKKIESIKQNDMIIRIKDGKIDKNHQVKDELDMVRNIDLKVRIRQYKLMLIKKNLDFNEHNA